MIVINTEFGRGYSQDPAIHGRDHWTGGYAAILIGGPVNGAANVPAIAGDIRNGDAVAIEPQAASPAWAAFSPTDVQAAVVLAAGVDPVDSESSNFAVTDFSPTIHDASREQTRLNLKSKILGA